MSFKIAIASGKGGTGKTTVAANLFYFFNKLKGERVTLVDCDVEEPNDGIFFQDATWINEKNIYQFVPVISVNRCTFCKCCVEYCEFNAMVIIPSVKFADVNANLCHSCGACLVACKNNAIKEKKEIIGTVAFYELSKDQSFIEGRLKVGSAMQTMLIKELKSSVPDNKDLTLYDAPPGTSCSVVETINDTDYVLLVAEPTLFGLHDLKLMTELLKQLDKPFGVVINKAGLGDRNIYDFLSHQHIELLGEIPFSNEYAASYANGNLFEDIPATINESYIQIIESLEFKMTVYEGNNYFKW